MHRLWKSLSDQKALTFYKKKYPKWRMLPEYLTGEYVLMDRETTKESPIFDIQCVTIAELVTEHETLFLKFLVN